MDLIGLSNIERALSSDPDSKLTSKSLDFSAEPQCLIYSIEIKIKFHGLMYIKCQVPCLEYTL